MVVVSTVVTSVLEEIGIADWVGDPKCNLIRLVSPLWFQMFAVQCHSSSNKVGSLAMSVLSVFFPCSRSLAVALYVSGAMFPVRVVFAPCYGFHWRLLYMFPVDSN